MVRLFNKMRDKVRDKLSQKQYDDEVSWTTCTWSALMAQRMSVALHMAAAWEIARELSLAGAEDEAALFGVEGSPTPLPKFASNLAHARLGAVCVSLCFIVRIEVR